MVFINKIVHSALFLFNDFYKLIEYLFNNRTTYYLKSQ